MAVISSNLINMSLRRLTSVLKIEAITAYIVTIHVHVLTCALDTDWPAGATADIGNNLGAIGQWLPVSTL